MKIDLVAERVNRGYSSFAFAEAVGLPSSTYRRLETGEHVSPATAKKVADYLGCKVTDLMPLPVPEPDAA
jgi:transcriptional regulator with XRE-family HTH domain